MFKLVASTFGLIILNAFISSNQSEASNKDTLYQLQGKTQGTTYSIKYIAKHQLLTAAEIDSVFSVFDHSLSRYQKSSLLTALNKPRKTARIDAHLYHVLQEAIKFQAITNGCFDYRLLPLQRLWGFESNNNIAEPSIKSIQQTLYHSSSNYLKISQLDVVKSSKKLEIDLDGIAQGYCVDVLARFLVEKGINDFIVELGGELAVAGKDINRNNWRIGIADAHYKDDRTAVSSIIKEGSYALTTAGSFHQYKKTGSKVVSHVFDPRTGYPVDNGIISVTVMAPQAVEADALDNAFMVMGVPETFEWVKKYPNIGVYITYINEKGEKADTANSYFKQYMVKD